MQVFKKLPFFWPEYCPKIYKNKNIYYLETLTGNILDLIYEASSESIAITDLGGNFTRVSKHTARLLGYPDPESLIGKNIIQVTHPDYYHQAWYVRNKAFETGKSENQVLGFIRMDGTMVEVITDLFLFRDQIIYQEVS